jgi:hypothetical protein
MKAKIIKLELVDKDVGVGENPIQQQYYLLNPSKEKLQELKSLVENRFDYMSNDDLTDEQYLKAQELVDNIWEAIDLFVTANFIVLDIEDNFKINY